VLFANPEQQYRVVRHIRKHQFISASDITPLRLIEVGQKVLAKYQSGGIKLEAKARALSAGNVNDTITVLLSHQKEPVNAVIQNRMEVYVQQ
jgi:flagella basal body P-ring formation protein FlgA